MGSGGGEAFGSFLKCKRCIQCCVQFLLNVVFVVFFFSDSGLPNLKNVRNYRFDLPVVCVRVCGCRMGYLYAYTGAESVHICVQ